MKHFYTFLMMCTGTLAFAQCAPNLANTTPGVFPANLTTGCVNVAYTDTLDIVSPADTVLFSFTLPFDSVIVAGVLNLPAGMNYACGNINCTTVAQPPQLMHSCILINGVPTSTTAANATIQIVTVYYVTVPFVGVQSIPDTLEVGLVIDACLGVQNSTSITSAIYPNPAQDVLNIDLSSEMASDAAVRIFNATGQLVYTSNLTNVHTAIELSGFSAGMYLVEIQSGGNTTSERIIVE